ncbi:MAG: hypothetical protein ACTSO7_05650 [Candidatus Heimdallarchaeota archaeon]
MKRKNHLLMSFLLINIIFISLSNADGSIVWFNYDDDVDDVTFYDHRAPQYTGDYHDEIDIIGLHLEDNNLVFLFQEPPIWGINHTYHLIVYWTNTPGKNYTSAIFGYNINVVSTYLQNSAHHDVAWSTIYDSITIERYSLVVPIPIVDYMPRIDSPEYMEILSIVVVGQDLQFEDFYNGTTFCKPYTTTILSEPYLSVFVAAIFILAVIKKKKR